MPTADRGALLDLARRCEALDPSDMEASLRLKVALLNSLGQQSMSPQIAAVNGSLDACRALHELLPASTQLWLRGPNPASGLWTLSLDLGRDGEWLGDRGEARTPALAYLAALLRALAAQAGETPDAG